MFGVPNTPHSSIARLNLSRCGSNGESIATLPIGEPMAESLNPSPWSSSLNSRICASERASTFVLWIDPNSMCRTPHDFNTATCSRESGEISSAKAERVNMWQHRYGVTVFGAANLVETAGWSVPLLGEHDLLVLAGQDHRDHERRKDEDRPERDDEPLVLPGDGGDQEGEQHHRRERDQPEGVGRDVVVGERLPGG